MKILSRIKWVFSSNFYEEFVLNYKVHNFFYINYLNKKLKKSKTNCKVELINDETSRYIITDLKNDLKKRFNFRKQGLLFLSGIIERGESMSRDYHVDAIEFANDDIVIDCGANTGDLFIHFENMENDIIYFGIEPGKDEFKCLEKNISKNHQLHNICLGDKSGQVNFYYKPEFGDSSIMQMNDYEDTYIAKIITLDDFVKEQKIENRKIKLLKLEAEGAEPEICYGAIKTLINIQYISVDVGFERGITQTSTAPEVVNFLLKNNFSLIKVGESRMCYLFKNNNLD